MSFSFHFCIYMISWLTTLDCITNHRAHCWEWLFFLAKSSCVESRYRVLLDFYISMSLGIFIIPVLDFVYVAIFYDLPSHIRIRNILALIICLSQHSQWSLKHNCKSCEIDVSTGAVVFTMGFSLHWFQLYFQ